MNRYIIAFVGFLLLVIALLVIIFSGGKKAPTPAQPVKTLPDYSTSNAEVSLTIDGKVDGEDIHRAIRVSVDRYQRKLDILGGYNYNLLETHTFGNNQAAYDVFLRAINGAGFTSKNSKYKVDDERGKCPLGFRYIFELNDGGNKVSRLWSSTCSGVGTLGGNSAQLQTLFKAQITDYNKLTAQVKM
jgi:hypothetical protein